MVLEAKAREEHRLVPSGHQVVNMRLRAHFNEADWAAEQMTGISYLFFLRKLAKEVDDNWQKVLDDLKYIHSILLNRNNMVINVTQDEEGWTSFRPQVNDFLGNMPEFDRDDEIWSPDHFHEYEGMSIPSQVNYVGKGANLYDMGYNFHGSVHVITRFLRNSWLWEQVRVKGGAYGSFCLFERFTGTLTFVSYRDPNLLKTLDVFDLSARFLRDLKLDEDELAKSIIGSIGDIDGYKLPDAKGYSSMIYKLTGDTDENRQKIREEILGTKAEDFKSFADMLEGVRENGLVKVLGSEEIIRGVDAKKPGWLTVLKVL
jgi:Zn-dependent M16 (insulinase) family peptidase